MKKVVLFFIFIILSCPTLVMAMDINEYPPYINIKNKDNYDIEKIIDEDTVTVRLKKKNDKTYYSWSFDKEKIGNEINLDFEITFNEDTEIKEKIGEEIDVKYLTFKHHGTLPSNAKVTVYVGDKFKDKEKLYLYYYNEESKKIEYISKDIKVSQGYIEFVIEHCSKYFVTSSSLNLDTAISTNISVNYILFILIGLTIIVIGKVLFTNNELKEG